MTVTVDIDIRSVLKMYANLPRATRNKTLRPALRAGAKVIRDQAVQNIKSVTKGDGTKIGQRSVTVYQLKQVQGRLRVAVAVTRKKVNKYKIVNGKPVRVGLYLSVLEYGKHNQPPTGWLRGAARGKESAAFNQIAAVAAKNLPAAIQEAQK